MRICYLIHVFPPESWGGSENYVLRLAQQMRQRHETAVFTRTARPDQPEYKVIQESVDGLEVFRLNNNFQDVDRFERIYRNPRVDAIFDNFLEEWRPDIVHAHHLTCLSTNLVNMAQQRSIPIILTLHDFWMMCLRGQRLHPTLRLCEEVLPEVCGQCVKPWMDGAHARAVADRFGGGLKERGFLRKMAKMAFRWWKRPNPTREIEKFHRYSRGILGRVDLLISPSAFLRDRFVEFGCDPGKIIVSDNGIAPLNLRVPARSPTEKIRFGFVGTLIPSKGVHLLVEAFKQLPQGKAELVVFGAPAEYEGYPEYYQDLQKSAAGTPIAFKGQFTPDAIGTVLSQIDVLVVPSIWYENAPLTIREAFLAHIPVITADRGGMAESVHDGVNGLHFEMGDANSLARAMLRLTDDSDLRHRLSSASPTVKNIADNAGELESLYARLCGVR